MLLVSVSTKHGLSARKDMPVLQLCRLPAPGRNRRKSEAADGPQGSVATGSGGRGQPHASASCCGRGRPRRQTISAARRHGRRTLGMLYVRGRPGMMGSVVSMMFIRWRGSMGCMMTTRGQAPHTESQRQQHGTENAVHKNSFARSGEIQRNGGGKKAPVTKGRLLFPSVFFLRPDMLFARERPAACLLPGTPFTVTLQLRSYVPMAVTLGNSPRSSCFQRDKNLPVFLVAFLPAALQQDFRGLHVFLTTAGKQHLFCRCHAGLPVSGKRGQMMADILQTGERGRCRIARPNIRHGERRVFSFPFFGCLCIFALKRSCQLQRLSALTTLRNQQPHL